MTIITFIEKIRKCKKCEIRSHDILKGKYNYELVFDNKRYL